MPKMVVTAVYAMTNNNEQRTTNYSKQTQSNPIYGEQTRPKCSRRGRTTRSELACGEPACTEFVYTELVEVSNHLW
jgi:hypothetical protein